jgi:acyl-CoA synthetase (AMP-forming)/AMP-acid ligase II
MCGSFASRLAAFKLPKSYDVVDALPRGAHGKLEKRLLREPYWT